MLLTGQYHLKVRHGEAPLNASAVAEAQSIENSDRLSLSRSVTSASARFPTPPIPSRSHRTGQMDPGVSTSFHK